MTNPHPIDELPPRDDADELPPRDAPDDLPPDAPPLEAPPLEATTLRRVLQPFLVDDGPHEIPATPAELVVYHRAELLNQQMLALPVPTTDAEAARVSEYLEVSRQLQDAITAELAEPRKAAYNLWKSLCATVMRRAGLLQNGGDKHARNILGLFIANKRADAERARREDLERQRVAREREARDQAAALTAAGQPELAAEQTRFALEAPLVEPPPAAQVKIPGVVGRTYYDVVIVSPSSVPREYCSPDLRLLQAAATANKGKITIPGVTVTERTTAARSGRR